MGRPAVLAIGSGLAAVTVLAAVAMGAGAEPGHPEFDPDSSLLVSTRTELRICLDTHGQVDADRAATELAAATAEVGGHPDWGPSGYGAAPKVERGCPTTLPGPLDRGTVVGPGVTATPGPYRTVVVVLDGPTADRYLADAPAALLPYERMLVGEHVTATVSQAVAVRADFLGRPGFAADYLTPALGLDPARR